MSGFEKNTPYIYEINLQNSPQIKMVSTDSLLSEDSDNIISTQKAIKSYVDKEDFFDNTGSSIYIKDQSNHLTIANYNVNEYLENYIVPGLVSQPTIINNYTGNEITIGTCDCYIFYNNKIDKYTIPQQIFSLDINKTTYIYATVVNDVPQYLKTILPADIDYKTKIGISHCYNNTSNDIMIANYGIKSYSLTKDIQKLLYQKFRINWVNGSNLTCNLRKILISKGYYWLGLNEIILDNYDSTNVSFHSHYNNGSWVELTASDFDNQNYNQYGVGLTSILNSTKFSFYDVYRHITQTSEIDIVYGQAQYNTQSEAENAPLLSLLPPSILYGGLIYVFIGRIIYHKDSLTAESIINANYSKLNYQTITNHSLLANLDADDHIQYFKKIGRTNENLYVDGKVRIKTNTEGNTVDDAFKVKTPFTKNAISCLYPVTNDDVAVTLLGQATNISDIAMGLARSSSTGGWTFQNVFGGVLIETNGANLNILNKGGSYTKYDVVPSFNNVLLSVYDTGNYTVRIPNAYNNGISGTTHNLSIRDDGTLGLVTSLRRHKKEIEHANYEQIIYNSKVHTILRYELKNNEAIQETDENNNLMYDIDGNPIYKICSDSVAEPTLIAEEVEENFHNLCVYEDIANKDSYNTTLSNGEKIEKKPPQWKLCSVNYEGFIPCLIYVAQEQKKQLDINKNEISNLKIRVNLLENQLSNILSRISVLETL